MLEHMMLKKHYKFEYRGYHKTSVEEGEIKFNVRAPKDGSKRIRINIYIYIKKKKKNIYIPGEEYCHSWRHDEQSHELKDMKIILLFVT